MPTEQTMSRIEFVNGEQHIYDLRYPFEHSDAGRSHSLRPKQSNDCTVRALALACGIEYDKAYDLLASVGRKCGQGFHFRQWVSNAVVNECKFIWVSFPAVKGQLRMNPARFCAENKSGTFIIKTAKHVAAIIDGVLYDTTPERPDRCIYGAWKIERLR